MQHVSSNVQNSHQAINMSINTVQRTLDSLQSSSTTTAQIVAQNQSNILGTASIMAQLQASQNSHGLSLTSIQNSTQSIQQQMTAIVHASNSDHDSMRVTVQSALREELPALRDAVLGIMTGRIQELSRDERIAASQLSPLERTELESQIERQLIMRPSALREASDFVSLPKRRGKPCNCLSSSLSSSYIRGPFGIKVEYSSQHRPSCHYYRTGKWSSRYAASARLLPFVQKTVELGMSLTFGAGCFSIAPRLSASCTVKRSESSVFKLFDEFLLRCPIRILHSSSDFSQEYVFYEPGNEFLWFDCGIPAVKNELINLINNLEVTIHRKTGSGSDKDEHGNTVLHVSHN